MQLVNFTNIAGAKISIVADKITGFIECQESFRNQGNTYIATGADGIDGAANGWYVVETFNTVTAILQST